MTALTIGFSMGEVGISLINVPFIFFSKKFFALLKAFSLELNDSIL